MKKSFIGLIIYALYCYRKINIIIENKNGGVDWINTFIVNLVAPFFKDTIINVVQEEVTNTIRTYFDEVNK